jgi:hypothetical protein
MDATDDVARFTPARDKMGGFVASPPGVDPNSAPYKIGQWASKKAPVLDKLVPEAPPAPGSGYSDVQDDVEWGQRLVSAIQKPKKFQFEGSNIVSQSLNVPVQGVQALRSPVARSIHAAAYDSVGDGVAALQAAPFVQGAQAPISPGREAEPIQGVGEYTKASTWENMKSKLQSNPKALGKFAAVLDRAMAEGGDQGLRVAHWRLSMNDPEYQQILKNSQE